MNNPFANPGNLLNYLGQQTHTPLWATAATAAAAATLAYTPAWKITRNVVTIAHEGGHALVAAAMGRKLAGIQLNADTSGVTVSAGKPYGLGVIATTAVGYPAPALMGLAAAYALHDHLARATLIGVLGLLALMLIFIRNLYGVLTITLTGAAVWAAVHYTSSLGQGAMAHLLAWFLLLAATRPVLELHHHRKQGDVENSDADQLAQLTHIPAIVWTGLFLAVAAVSVVYGTYLLLF